MDTGLSYEPGTNVYSDVVFGLLLLIGTIISYWCMFYGLRYLLTPDRKRVMNKEKYVAKLVFKSLLLSFPVAVLIGFPLFANVVTSALLLTQAFFSLFDNTREFDYIIGILFIGFYCSYIYFYFKKINQFIDTNLQEAIDFYSDWDPLIYYGPDSIDPGLYESRRNSTIWTIRIYKFALHFSVVPVLIITILRLFQYMIT